MSSRMSSISASRGVAWHWDRVHAVGKDGGMTGDVHRKSEELEGKLKSGTEATCNR